MVYIEISLYIYYIRGNYLNSYYLNAQVAQDPRKTSAQDIAQDPRKTFPRKTSAQDPRKTFPRKWRKTRASRWRATCTTWPGTFCACSLASLEGHLRNLAGHFLCVRFGVIGWLLAQPGRAL